MDDNGCENTRYISQISIDILRKTVQCFLNLSGTRYLQEGLEERLNRKEFLRIKLNVF